MSDTNTPALAIGIVAVLTALGSVAVLVLKLVKKSNCCGMVLETRTPPPSIIYPPPPPSPRTEHHDKQSESTIREVEV